MNRLPIEKRVQILGCLTEGMSLRATSRVADVSLNTVTKLLVDVGMACAIYQNETLRNLPCKRLQVDEIWSFTAKKERNVAKGKQGYGVGDTYTWVAIDADTKLVAGWLVGRREPEYAHTFMEDLASRLANRVQLTTDGFRPYLTAVDNAFAGNIDYAMLVKLYSSPHGRSDERRYSGGECCGAIKGTVCGKPEERHVSTSYVERQNLTMRMHMRRFTRLTNGFSKKIWNHELAVAMHYMFYNFAKIHKTLRVTPAMQAGIADHAWSPEEMAALAD